MHNAQHADAARQASAMTKLDQPPCATCVDKPPAKTQRDRVRASNVPAKERCAEIQLFKRCVVAASTGEPARLPPFPPTPRDQCAVHACRKFQLAAWARAHFARKGAHCGWHRAHQAHVGRGLGGQLTCGACARVSAGPAWTRRMCKTHSDSRPRHQGKRGAMEPKTLTVQPATTPLSSLARKRWLLERASIPTART